MTHARQGGRATCSSKPQPLAPRRAPLSPSPRPQVRVAPARGTPNRCPSRWRARAARARSSPTASGCGSAELPHKRGETAHARFSGRALERARARASCGLTARTRARACPRPERRVVGTRISACTLIRVREDGGGGPRLRIECTDTGIGVPPELARAALPAVRDDADALPQRHGHRPVQRDAEEPRANGSCGMYPKTRRRRRGAAARGARGAGRARGSPSSGPSRRTRPSRRASRRRTRARAAAAKSSASSPRRVARAVARAVARGRGGRLRGPGRAPRRRHGLDPRAAHAHVRAQALRRRDRQGERALCRAGAASPRATLEARPALLPRRDARRTAPRLSRA